MSNRRVFSRRLGSDVAELMSWCCRA